MALYIYYKRLKVGDCTKTSAQKQRVSTADSSNWRHRAHFCICGNNYKQSAK